MSGASPLDRPVGALSLVTARARALLPDPAQPLAAPRQVPVWDQVAAWAERTPGAPAVSAAGGVLDYAGLATRARAVAARLHVAGLQRGDVVALEDEPDAGWVAGALGVLAAGGVLLGIDPALPAERQALMLQVARARRLAELPPPAADPSPESADAGGEERMNDHDPAYLFFTSGSTGTPKAVLGAHGGLAHFLSWERDAFAVGPGDRVSLLTSPSFDVVLRDLFLPLVSGATLCIPPRRPRAGAEAFAWLERERITVAHVVPSVVWSWLAAGAGGAGLAALRVALFAGEPLRAELVTRWRTTFPGAGAVVNLYGPTETTLARCHYQVPEPPHPGMQPVGRPLPDSQALVLTPGRAQCGIGEPGEIAIRTPFRTLGYVDRPEDNAARFVVSPFTGDGQDLLYLTGDLGRVRPDGTLEVLGRVDDQLKIHGVRIEPGEVEAMVRAHPTVGDAAVVARPGPDGSPRLLAYVACGGAAEPPADLRRFLAERLPAAMVPAHIVAVAVIPRLASGKVDRGALPEPPAPAAGSHRAPRTDVEQGVAEAWREVIGAEDAGPDDDFYGRGGDSLAVLALAAALERRFGVSVGLAALHGGSTLAEQAAVVDAALRPGPASEPRRAAEPTPAARADPAAAPALHRVAAPASVVLLAAGIYLLHHLELRPQFGATLGRAPAGVATLHLILALLLAAGLLAAVLDGARRTLALTALSAAAYPLLLGPWALLVLGYAGLLVILVRAPLPTGARMTAALAVWLAAPVTRALAVPVELKMDTFWVGVVWAQLAYAAIYLVVERARHPERPAVTDDLFYLLALPRLIEPFFQPLSPRLVRARRLAAPATGVALRGLALGAYGLALGAATPWLWQWQEQVGGTGGAAIAMAWFYCLSAGQIFIAVALFRLLGHDLPSGFKAPYLARSFGEFFRRFNHYVRDAVVSLFYLPALDRLRRTRLSPGMARLLAGYLAIFVGSFLLNSLLVPMATSLQPLAALHQHVNFKRMLLLSIYWTAILLPAGLAEPEPGVARPGWQPWRVVRFLALYALLWLAAWTLDAQLH